jgi:hypothetical protein
MRLDNHQNNPCSLHVQNENGFFAAGDTRVSNRIRSNEAFGTKQQVGQRLCCLCFGETVR